MPLTKNTFTDSLGTAFDRTEDESSIEWRISNHQGLYYTYKKLEKTWYSHHRKCPTIRREDDCCLEIEFQNHQVPTQPQYRLVSRGQSLKTGEEVIELHVHVLPRGRWEKMPLEVKIVPELNWTLKELENWIKESWSTH